MSLLKTVEFIILIKILSPTALFKFFFGRHAAHIMSPTIFTKPEIKINCQAN